MLRSWVRSHVPSIQSKRGTKVVWPDFQPMRVPEEPVCIDLFRQYPVFTSLHLKSPVHVHRLGERMDWRYMSCTVCLLIEINVNYPHTAPIIQSKLIILCTVVNRRDSEDRHGCYRGPLLQMLWKPCGYFVIWKVSYNWSKQFVYKKIILLVYRN